MGKKYTLFACLLICFVSGSFSEDVLNGLLSKLPKYSIVQPQIIHRTTRSIDKDKHKEADELISYLIEINHKKHRLHLQRNREFLHPDLFSYVKSKKVAVHCYYHGEVEGYTDSMVAVSTCSGLRGVIVLEEETFGLEPLPGSTTNEHVLYDLSDVHSGATTCGVSDVEEFKSSQNETHFEPGRTLTSLLRKKRALATTSYVELALVADKLRYDFKKGNETAVREEMVEVANLVDGYYKRLNIRVMLVHLEVFMDGNPFSVDGEPGHVLGDFAKWRKDHLLPRSRNDMAQLVIGRSGAYGAVVGMAYVGTVCSTSTSAGINVYSDNSLPYFSTIVAHEMGHNLGMNHDSGRCTCDGGCIMDAGGGSVFSTCSENDYEKLVKGGGGVCLRNIPSHSDVVGIARCGNGLLEEGEQCDCGTPAECKDKCCNAATCRFTQGSVCAAGRCCQDCQLKVAGSPCRGSENTCDLPEFCTGKSAFCPDDYYLMDGLKCQSGVAYCYEGRCQTYNFQCQHLFSDNPGASKADDICFKTANERGNLFGNCGQTSSGGYIKCASEDVMCGKVQCTNVDANHPPPGGSISIQIVNGSKCVNADFHLGPDVVDPAYSNPGSPCAPGKTCVDFKCVDAVVLLPDLKCDAKTTCHGHGVCNNQGHCHCDVGWAPPDCTSSGPGGSIDSGPATIDYSLRNGLLIFFLLVVPLLVLLVFLFLYMFRRDTLDPCLKRRHKSRSTPNTRPAPAQVNVSVPAHTSTQLPQPPVERPEYPPKMAEYPPDTGVPGWKYGELDYWKDQDQDPSEPPSGVPPRPVPHPRQGPGVPRPIPPRAPPKLDE